MPEGDTIFRAARALNRALAGKTLTGFRSEDAHLAAADDESPFVGRTVERVEARGKHLLMFLSGDRILHTHMRMHGSWHIYRPGEAWHVRQSEARIVMETADFVAVAFNVPVITLLNEKSAERHEGLSQLGPDLLSESFDAAEGLRRLRSRPHLPMGEALLNQRLVAGMGNVYKSELLFLAGVHPQTPVRQVSDDSLRFILEKAGFLLRANTHMPGMRRTHGSLQASQRLWVYGRKAEACRKCSTPIQRFLQGEAARSTYFCALCQPPSPGTAEAAPAQDQGTSGSGIR